ncbi:MAG: NusA N-terminal domain-containing protein, partial [Senegalia sp. (in: firmicutes)]
MKAEFIQALEEIGREKGISKEILIDAIEAALISAYKRNFGSSQNVEVIIDNTTGDVKVYAQKDVVNQVEDELLQISL